MINVLKKIIPEPVVALFRMPYHFFLQFGAALMTGFPASQMTVIGVTGTKGKSTVVDMMYAVLVAAGYRTALASTIHFVTPAGEQPNKFKMTMQGRGFIQRFLARAKKDGATHAVVEITSEGTKQFRHRFLNLDALIVTNIQREHIESHGSFENYVAAKRAIVAELEHSSKPNRALVSNGDIAESNAFLHAQVPMAIPFYERELEQLVADDRSVHFVYKTVRFEIPLAGIFNAMNALAVIKLAEQLEIPLEKVAKGLSTMLPVKGRVEHVSIGTKQEFLAIVDYAHTPDSLRALYDAFATHKKICVLGNTGGGRDTWKRPEMGKIADELCETVILTNEDPYDEDPRAIVDAMAAGMKRKPQIIMDRREAIREALRLAKLAQAGNQYCVLISGKGTDPYIMEAHGKKTPWSDVTVVREELEKLFENEVH